MSQVKKVTISWNWNSVKQIRTAERRKAYYENKGYTQTDSTHNAVTGVNTLTYEDESKKVIINFIGHKQAEIYLYRAFAPFHTEPTVEAAEEYCRQHGYEVDSVID